jgi:hypothetical protein
MAEKFIGVSMVRDLKWGFTCEQCGKTVEVTSGISSRFGEKITGRKAFAELSEAGKQKYLAEARSEFPKVCENFVSQWNNGVYPNFIIDKQQVCPYCYKYQHWSKKIVEMSAEKSTIGDSITGSFGAIILSFILSGIVWLIIRNGIVFWILFILLSIIWSILCIFGAKSTKKQLLQQKAELENKAKQLPQFISWGDTKEEITSYASV